MAAITPAEMQTKVNDFLKSLGTGPNKVAETLKEMKIKGYRTESSRCPIARAVRKNFKNLKHITISHAVEFNYRGEECIAPLPAAISKFLNKFDCNNYPELAFADKFDDNNYAGTTFTSLYITPLYFTSVMS